MTALFIGGPEDGQRREVVDSAQIKIFAAPPLRSFTEREREHGDDFAEVKHGEHTYNSTWPGAFVYDGIEPAEAMARLCDGYHPGEAIEAELSSWTQEVKMSEADRRRRIQHLYDTGRSNVTIILPPKP